MPLKQQILASTDKHASEENCQLRLTNSERYIAEEIMKNWLKLL